MEIILIALMIGIPVAASILTGGGKKRGCGGGCATCGNREICHRKRKA